MEKIEPIAYLLSPKEIDGHPNPNIDPRQWKILEQVKNFCGEDKQEDDKRWREVWTALRQLSILSCWVDSPEDTFITQVRHQSYYGKQENICCRECNACDAGLIHIPLEYEPVPEKGFIGGSIVIYIEGDMKTQEISSEYLNTHTDWASGILTIKRDDFPNILSTKGGCGCACEYSFKIYLDYNAGYEEIPQGLLPVICALIDKTKAMLGNDCANSMTQVSGLLKRKKQGNIEYEWSTKEGSAQELDKLYSELSTLGFMDEVMSISRCAIAADNNNAGDVI